MLHYHHCRSLDGVIYGIVKASPAYADQDFKDAYSWLEKEVMICEYDESKNFASLCEGL